MNMTDILGTDDTVPTAIPGSETDQDQDVTTPYRWPLALAVGVLLGVPVGWLLSHVVFLPYPFYPLGLFFFVLFGLVIGAVVYRVGAACRPAPRARVRTGVFVVVAVCFGCSLLAEATRFPTDVAESVLRGDIRKLPKGVSPDAFRADCAEFVRDRLQEVAWPGGVAGYFRWTIASGRLEVRVRGLSQPVIYRAPMYRWWWLLRAMSTLSLLTFGVASQMAGLGPPRANAPDVQGDAS